MGLVADGPGLLRAHIQAGDRAHHDQRAFAHVQRAHLLAGEIKKARNIHQIDLLVLPLQRRHGGGEGDMPLDLLRVVVHGRLAVLHAALPVDGAGSEQHRLGQRRLANAAMADQGQVADILGQIVFHREFPLYDIFAHKRNGWFTLYALICHSIYILTENSTFEKPPEPSFFHFAGNFVLRNQKDMKKARRSARREAPFIPPPP